MSDSLGSITAGEVKKAINKMNDETILSFEFIISSFFPKAF